MDLWVVAAITGAGYAAKYLQNFSREKDGGVSGLVSTSSVSKKPDSPPLIPRFGGNGNLLDGRFGENVETASTSGFEGEVYDSYSEEFEVSARVARGHRRGQSSLRSRNIELQYLRPLSSLDSCVIAQFYKERSEREDHVLTPLLSPCIPALRPFVVTDGTRVISRPSFDSFSVQVRDDKKVHSKAYSERNEAVLGGIPWLPERGSGERSKESNLMKGKGRVNRLSSIGEMSNENKMSSQEPQSGVALFCLGVSIGVMHSTLKNKREVTELEDVLKQTKNLVQDLQEELEMNDSLTVKELVSVSEHNDFVYEHESSTDSKKTMVADLQSDSEALMNYGVESCDAHKEPKNLESMIQIEAELEAELERLEFNMKGSTVRAKYSDDDDEPNADIVADLVQGELRADILSRKPTSDPSRDNGSSSSSTTPCSPNQAVSPRELSLRLNQVIQSRLEQRIMELEVALEKSQKRVNHLESEQGLFSHIVASSSSSSSSSSRRSPITSEAGYQMESHPEAKETERELPLVMNLSGEALDAYNEAFEELNKINGSKFEERNSSMYKEIQEKSVDEEEVLTANCETLEKWEVLRFDDGDDEDDDTTLLIKQIVEKTRQGSSAILHAHRAMVSLDNSNEK